MSEYGYTLTPWEIEMVRNKLKANVLMGLDNTAQVSEDIGRQLLTHGRRIHPTEMLARNPSFFNFNVLAVIFLIHTSFTWKNKN